jgi:hypothetical protein
VKVSDYNQGFAYQEQIGPRAGGRSVLEHLATCLEFPHPRTGERTVVECPPPPGLRR